MKYVSAISSFIVVFGGVFFLAGWLLMPHLPPVPDRPVSAFEVEYWIDNWAGVVLGVIFGTISAHMALKQKQHSP